MTRTALHREHTALRQRVAFFLAQKPPRVKAASLCILRLHDLTTRLLRAELRAERKLKRAS